MRIHFALLSASAALFCVASVACSSSSTNGGSGAGAVSSVDSSKTASALSDSEAQQYCEDSQRYFAAHVDESGTKKLSCGLTAQIYGALDATTDAEAQANCKTRLTECMNKASDDTAGVDAGTGTGGQAEDPCTSFKQELKGCNATVGEVNQCVADQMAAFNALASKDFCAEAHVFSSDGGLPSSSSGFESPASCKAIESKCPGFAGSSSSDVIDDVSTGDGAAR